MVKILDFLKGGFSPLHVTLGLFIAPKILKVQINYLPILENPVTNYKNALPCFDLNLMLGIGKVQPKLVAAVYLVKSEKFFL